MPDPRFIHADSRVVAQRALYWHQQEKMRAAIATPAKNVLVAKQWCPVCAAMTDHANLCPGCYPYTGGSHIGQSRPCPQCHDQIQEADAYRQWCVDCGHEGTPYPTYEQDGQTLLDQPDERAICAACQDTILSEPMTYDGVGPLHAVCALRVKIATTMQGVVPALLAHYEDRRAEVPADAEARYRSL